MNIQEIYKALSKEMQLSQKQSHEIVSTLMDIIRNSLIRGKEVKLHGIGTIKVKEKAVRKIVLPPCCDGRVMDDSGKTLTFRPSAKLKAQL